MVQEVVAGAKEAAAVEVESWGEAVENQDELRSTSCSYCEC